ncbi:MAG: hypothetical protein WCL60_12065 [Methylococcales bacterium]
MQPTDALGDLGNTSSRPIFCHFSRDGFELNYENIAGSVSENIKPMVALRRLKAAEIARKLWFGDVCQTCLQRLLYVGGNDPVKMTMQKLFYVATEPKAGVRAGTQNAKVAKG